ncbi:hypothetical protein WCWAEYFT_CDS0235 [Vibrio phage VB_VaC_TDDLMA]
MKVEEAIWRDLEEGDFFIYNFFYTREEFDDKNFPPGVLIAKVIEITRRAPPTSPDSITFQEIIGTTRVSSGIITVAIPSNGVGVLQNITASYGSACEIIGKIVFEEGECIDNEYSFEELFPEYCI